MTPAHKQQKTAPAGRGSEANGAATGRSGQRRRHRVSKTICILLFFAILANGGPLDLSQWKYRKGIPLTPGDGLAAVKLDREVYAAIGSRYYKIRVFRDNDEVPFVFGGPNGPNLEDRAGIAEQVLDQSIVSGVGLQFTVHRRHGGSHNKIDILTELKNFRNRVRIETSPDGAHWATARDDGAIFNFSQDGREFSSTGVSYPVSTRPYLRVTIFGWTKNGLVTGAVVDHQVGRPEVFELFATLRPHTWKDAATQSTLVQIDLGMTGLPVYRLRLQSPSPQFQRAVGIETSDDAKSWAYSGGGTIARLPGPEFTEESLTLFVGTQGHRYYRLRIYNRDDQPIQIEEIQAEGEVNQIKFLASTPGSYWLYYDGPGPELMAMPQYDLSAVLAHQTLPEHAWSLDKQEPSPFYHPPVPPRKPWSEQHPAILYTVLGGAVLALGVATFRFAARLKPTS